MLRDCRHLDSDELLHLPLAGALEGRAAVNASRAELQRHLARLSALGALQFTYCNLEAVPEEEEVPRLTESARGLPEIARDLVAVPEEEEGQQAQ